MKKYFSILIFFLLLCNSSGAQTETLTYCLSPVDSIFIQKVNEVQSGDSLIKTFLEDYNNTEYNVLSLYDTLYSEYNGNYYFLGTNQPTIGDQWHPLRYNFMSFQDSSVVCPNTMNVEVISINPIFFDGAWINEIELLDLDLQFGQYVFVEGIGITQGGPLYNLWPQYMCDVWFDFPNPVFRNYTLDQAVLQGDTCAAVAVEEIMSPVNTKLLRIVDLLGRETEDKPNTVLIYVYDDGTTRKVFKIDQ
jgi:hypothetical protein